MFELARLLRQAKHYVDLLSTIDMKVFILCESCLSFCGHYLNVDKFGVEGEELNPLSFALQANRAPFAFLDVCARCRI